MPEFRMPSLGSDMEDGTLVEWLVEPGQSVSKGDIVAVVDTMKGAIDIEVFVSGTVHELRVPVGEKVAVGTVLAIVLGEGESADDFAATATPGVAEIAGVEARSGVGPARTPAAVEVPANATATSGSVRVSPRARRRARELGVDAATLVGTGPRGSVTADDVDRAAGSRPKDPSSEAADGMRRAIAATMSRAKREIPHYYLGHTVDITDTLARLRASNEDRSIAARVLLAAIFVRATARALRQHPSLNGWWVDGGFVPSEPVHLGMAVSLRGGGLVAPAIHNADTLDLEALMAALRDVVKRARARSLRSSEMTDPTATLTSLGERGVQRVTGIIFPPQVALIGFGTVTERPWVVDGVVVPRWVVDISLAADHRASDGHHGARLLRTIADELEEPGQT